MKQFTLENVPPNMFTKAKLKKMELTPISGHIAFVTFPPKKRRYKLYSLENARPSNPNAGYSLLYADNSEEARKRFEEMRKRFQSD
ncbi:hypothetical protein [Paenibacillus nasutitermitis]|uniref:Uncharacterized protein n=1 Tax=Paenibacillus nasutitermitis TaxID=1652958 RepID=A0A916ZL92_9BACL|nr:hypothetical protein [Paenibacillus nasutitermitis]GGE03132.1 hypothetical protein GCM10010911_72780 [Paenibacillus nasutitermitis]